ncbi:hypothetical protein SAMN05660648_00442 [Selenomonas ruminantium]|jgi:hypothetical protein|uniref:Uncharacterized protein n=1 Tax=Selenomonas ruminantium TaxID=971 RepID=A0A1H3VPA5_SELRU|nr:hypothetical protein SAMN05660648_00442 [Selenomonas ruminantium]
MGGITLKRIVLTVFSLLLLSLASVANANYPTYLNGDRNLILCDGHMGVAWYVDRTTLNVEKYAPPQYIISVNIVTATSAYGNEQDFYSGGKGKITEVRRARFFYNWDLREMYVDSTGKDGWRFLPPLGSWAETGVSMPAGETAFYLAYKMKFYGSKKFYDSFLKKSICPYGDEFYARI